MRKIEAPAAWEITVGAPSVIVAVVDTGVDLSHPDLQGRLLPGFNLIDQALPPEDDSGHGTRVAGIIAANANNNIGIAGVASKVSILPVKVLDKDGFGLVDDVIAGLLWAVDNGARVINVSFFRNQSSPELEEAVEHAWRRGAIVVAAAGNASAEEPTYPAALESVVAVAATDARDGKLTGSNHGDWIDLGAPGFGIMSTSWSGSSTYETVSGTSFAAPHVSGTIALMLSVHPEITVQETEAILKATADGAIDPGLGAGRLNAARAVIAARDLAQRSSAPPLQLPTNQAPQQISPR